MNSLFTTAQSKASNGTFAEKTVAQGVSYALSRANGMQYNAIKAMPSDVFGILLEHVQAGVLVTIGDVQDYLLARKVIIDGKLSAR